MNEEIISEVAKRIRRSDRLYQLISYLKSHGVPEDQTDAYIAAAKDKIKDERIKSLPRKNKITFAILSAISLFALIAFIFILPKMGFQHTTFLAIVGAVIFSTTTILSIIYYNSWKEENVKQEAEVEQGDKEWLSILFVLVPIPAVIFSFIFSYTLESGADQLLKATQIETEGIIVGGSSSSVGVRRGSIDYSSVSVKFQTKDGKQVIAKEDVSKYEFRDFYKGQKVTLIYSSEDPQNIELLTNKNALKKFKDSEERDIKANDLITLIDAKDNQVLSLLNKITYGWTYDQSNDVYTNESKNMVFQKQPNEVVFVSGNTSMYLLPRQFMKLGFKDVTEGGIGNPMVQRKRSLENDQFWVTVERARPAQDGVVSTTLTKK